MVITPPQIPGLSDWRPLARGGFATVWQARQQSLNRLVAVKVDQRRLDAATERRRFLREAGAAGRMSGHPGIVTVHDAGILEDDRPFLVMELCPGGSLTRWLDPDHRPTPARVRQVGVRIADALAAAHSRGVLHRDVKPANILIDSYDNPGLADFGLAALPEPGEELSETLEAITPAYAPPEAFQQKPPTEFGDVFSLAATLYALLKGQPPRGVDGGRGPVDVKTAIDRQHQPIVPIPGVDPALMGVLMAALADDPTKRPTAAQFRDELTALHLSDPDAIPGAIPDPAPGPEAGSVEPRPRRRSVVAVAAVAALVVLTVGVFLAVRSSSTSAGQPVPTGSSTAESSPSASPTTSPSGPSSPSATSVPAGFADCSDEVGTQAYCPTKNECWGGQVSIFDSPALGTPQDCNKVHIYQTYAAGRLSYEVRRQSQLDQDKAVKKVCTAKLVNSMLKPADRRNDWEVYALPPQKQIDDADLYRCIFGRGERSAPLQLSRPG